MAETIGFIILAAADVAATAATLGTVDVAASAVVAQAIGGSTIFAGLTVAGAVGTAAVLGTSIAVAFATAPEVPKAGDGSAPIRQSIPPRPFGYGRARLGGSYMLFEVDADDNSYDVVAVHQGAIGQIVHIYLHDDMVRLNSSGFVAANLNGPSDGRYDTNDPSPTTTYIETRLGADPETAYSDLVTNIPTLWTSAHRGDEIASLYLKCANIATEFIPRTYPRGLPRPSIVGDLSPIWDPRDLAQDRDDPDTWEVSSNPVLQLLDYLTHADRGPALDYATFLAPVIDLWMAEADICDETVTKADGSTEPRYKSDGWAFMTTDPAEVINAILATCDGWLAENGDGTLALTVGKYRAPDVTFTDDHIFGMEIAKGVADEDLVNEVQFSYTAAQANWRDCPGVAMRDDTSIAEAGVVRSIRLQLPWVQSHSQGRRLAKRALARHVAPARGQITTSLYGLKALGERWVKVRSRQISDLADAVIEVSKVRVDLGNARLTFDWTLVNPNSIDAWDETTDEGEAPAYFPVPEDVTAADAGAGNQINVEFDTLDPEQSWLYYVLEYRVGTSGPWTREVKFASTDLTDIGGGRVRFQTRTAVSAGTYSVRVAATGAQTARQNPYEVRKTPVVVATTANITLSGTQTIDGVGVTVAQRVLVKNQSAPAENGIYTVAVGAWARATDMDVWAEAYGALVPVTSGTTNGGTMWASAAGASGTLGTTALTFASRADTVSDPDLVWSPSVGGVTGVVVS